VCSSSTGAGKATRCSPYCNELRNYSTRRRLEATGQRGFLLQCIACETVARVAVIERVLSYWRICEGQAGFGPMRPAAIDACSTRPRVSRTHGIRLRQRTGIDLAGLDVISRWTAIAKPLCSKSIITSAVG
jgi:hypothetical protein